MAKYDTMKILITLDEEMLGMCPGTESVYEEFIKSKAPLGKNVDDEDGCIEDEIGNKRTVFPKESGKPFLWDYQVKGFFKDSCKALRNVPGTESSKFKAYAAAIDGRIFVKPRKIFFDMSDTNDVGMGICERPLRAMTMKGERVALASSETVPMGSQLTMEIQCMNPGDMKLVREWLDYGELRGLGQWRNSGKGVFFWEELSFEEGEMSRKYRAEQKEAKAAEEAEKAEKAAEKERKAQEKAEREQRRKEREARKAAKAAEEAEE